MSENNDDKTNEQIKLELLKTIIGATGKAISNLDTIYIVDIIEFGNTMICINNIIYYCEILGCKNIYLNPRFNRYIKNKIVTDKLIISLNSQVNCNDPTTLCTSLYANFFWFNLIVVKPEIRFDVIKNEIKRNLPQLKINKEDLYIHIRINKKNIHYAQPPLCFYETIINNFKFKNIYLIANIEKSPIVDKLISKYPNIIFQKNSIEVDISYLANAYNIVGSMSSFLEVCVRMNDNLKNFFEFDVFKQISKILFLHHDFYYYPRKYNIFQMKSSNDYRNKMFVYKMTPEQDQYMIEEKCFDHFTIIKPT
jgi:hypothetical protein